MFSPQALLWPALISQVASVLADSQETDISPFRTIYFPPRSKLVAHATISSLGFLIFLPIGVLIARYRTTNPFWFKLHYFTQVFAGTLIIAGFALGVNYHHEAYNGGITDVDHHNAIGVTLFILYLVQLVLGSLIHYIKPPRFPSLNPFPANSHSLLLRPPQNYLHAILGLVIIILAFYQVRSGYRGMYPLWDGNYAPNGVNVVWILWVCIFSVVYVAGLGLLGVQWRGEKEELERTREGGGAEKTT